MQITSFKEWKEMELRDGCGFRIKRAFRAFTFRLCYIHSLPTGLSREYFRLAGKKTANWIFNVKLPLWLLFCHSIHARICGGSHTVWTFICRDRSNRCLRSSIIKRFFVQEVTEGKCKQMLEKIGFCHFHYLNKLDGRKK